MRRALLALCDCDSRSLRKHEEQLHRVQSLATSKLERRDLITQTMSPDDMLATLIDAASASPIPGDVASIYLEQCCSLLQSFDLVCLPSFQLLLLFLFGQHGHHNLLRQWITWILHDLFDSSSSGSPGFQASLIQWTSRILCNYATTHVDLVASSSSSSSAATPAAPSSEQLVRLTTLNQSQFLDALDLWLRGLWIYLHHAQAHAHGHDCAVAVAAQPAAALQHQIVADALMLALAHDVHGVRIISTIVNEQSRAEHLHYSAHRQAAALILSPALQPLLSCSSFTLNRFLSWASHLTFFDADEYAAMLTSASSSPHPCRRLPAPAFLMINPAAMTARFPRCWQSYLLRKRFHPFGPARIPSFYGPVSSQLSRLPDAVLQYLLEFLTFFELLLTVRPTGRFLCAVASRDQLWKKLTSRQTPLCSHSHPWYAWCFRFPFP